MRRGATQARLDTSDADTRPGSRAPVQLGRLEQLLGYSLRRAQVRVFQDFEAEMQELGLTPGQLGALFLIEANRGLSQSELGAALGIDRSSVVPLIDRLQKRGWVRRAARASDRRAHALELASKRTRPASPPACRPATASGCSSSCRRWPRDRRGFSRLVSWFSLMSSVGGRSAGRAPAGRQRD